MERSLCTKTRKRWLPRVKCKHSDRGPRRGSRGARRANQVRDPRCHTGDAALIERHTGGNECSEKDADDMSLHKSVRVARSAGVHRACMASRPFLFAGIPPLDLIHPKYFTLLKLTENGGVLPLGHEQRPGNVVEGNHRPILHELSPVGLSDGQRALGGEQIGQRLPKGSDLLISLKKPMGKSRNAIPDGNFRRAFGDGRPGEMRRIFHDVPQPGTT